MSLTAFWRSLSPQARHALRVGLHSAIDQYLASLANDQRLRHTLPAREPVVIDVEPMMRVGDRCKGCRARYRVNAHGNGHHGFDHEPGCRWEHRSAEGRRPGGQAVPIRATQG